LALGCIMDNEFRLELRRQILHVAMGGGVIVLFSHDLVSDLFFPLLLVAGIVTSYVSSKLAIPLISSCLRLFDRKQERIPGKGALFFVAGVVLVTAFFEKDAALAGIAILTVGDAVSRMGQFFGRIHFPWNKHKQIESSFLGFFLGAVAASFFISFPAAAAASFVAMLLESVPVFKSIWWLDDNIFIPTVSAGVVYLVSI
jgi:dolichol kinase